MLNFIYKIIKPKTKLEKLHDERGKLLTKAHKLSKTNRKESDKYIYKANEIEKKIELLISDNSKK